MTSRSEPSKYYFVRVHEMPGYKELIEAFGSDEDIENVLSLKHNGKDGENPHFHICLTYVNPMKIDAVRKRFATKFNKAKGQGHISIKKWDGKEKALSYMFHEETQDIIVNKLYSDEDIERFVKADEEVKEVYATRRGNSIFDDVEQRCMAEDRYDEMFIISHYLHGLKEKGKMYPGDFRMKNIVDTIRMKKDIDSAAHEIYDRIYSRFR